MKWQDAMRSLSEFLTETAAERTNTVFTKQFPDGSVVIISQARFGQKDSKTYKLDEQFLQKVDALLDFGQVTDACKAYLKKLAMLYYNTNATADQIIAILSFSSDPCGCGPFVEQNFSEYEFDLLYNKLDGDMELNYVEIILQELEFNLTWIEQFLARYGEHKPASDFQQSIAKAIASMSKRLAERQ